jgi:hypothetical protein
VIPFRKSQNQPVFRKKRRPQEGREKPGFTSCPPLIASRKFIFNFPFLSLPCGFSDPIVTENKSENKEKAKLF